MINKFMKIVFVEMEELEQDLKTLTEVYAEQFAQGRLTNYVTKENISVLKAEILGLHHITAAVKAWDYSACDTLECLIDGVVRITGEIIEKHQLPKGDMELVRNKLSKVKKYVTDEDNGIV